MAAAADELQSVLTALEPLLATAIRDGDTRLPPERDLAVQLGVPRRRLRLALDSGADLAELIADWARERATFEVVRREMWLY